MAEAKVQLPFHVFRFGVEFARTSLGAAQGSPEEVPLCKGAFAECSGLEASMEPKSIRVGGHNYGLLHRAGPVKFGTVTLRRGMTTERHLFDWFALVNKDGGYAYRLTATITMYDHAGRGLMAWRLDNALPVKFKTADLNAASSDVAVEEVQLVHEGLHLEAAVPPPATTEGAPT